MISTDKVVGFYTDVFGNEVDEYEQIERYTVYYEGYLFEGDTDGYNEHGYDKFEDAIALYHAYGDMIHIKDNEIEVFLNPKRNNFYDPFLIIKKTEGRMAEDDFWIRIEE